MAESTFLKRNVTWDINGTEYQILNVPFERLDADGNDFLDIDVALKMEIIKELMMADRIPHIVDFNLVADLELNV